MSNPEEQIPYGQYCHDENGTCPYWSLVPGLPSQHNGYCSYLKQGDWEYENSWDSLLWDQVKQCGVKE